MKLDEIAKYLEGQGLGTVARSIFVNEMPTGCSRGILLMNRAGTPIDHEMPGYYSGEFMCIVRSKEYKDGSDLADQCLKKLTSYRPLRMQTIEYKQLLPQSTPRDYRRQVSGFWEFEFDVTFQCTEL